MSYFSVKLVIKGIKTRRGWFHRVSLRVAHIFPSIYRTLACDFICIILILTPLFSYYYYYDYWGNVWSSLRLTSEQRAHIYLAWASSRL